ncbi:DUF1840 domain-containing protein [Derxia lacustris]|uniref:DUF1840 domain-containing protein n=1 Tax=Derxia lacustris TaxID=764842 RepID=UPI000A1751DE|nr:DUF1840 domain-containing protein [Derxia lacustris]
MSLVRFSSKAAAEVFMLEDHAARLIQAIGKTADARGVITAAQIPGALAALRGAIRAEQQAEAEAAARGLPLADEDNDEAKERRANHVSLDRRAFPLIEMLEKSGAKGVDVLWGV